MTNRDRRRSFTPWLILALFGIEFFLFDQHGARQHTGVYPRWNDQVQYLGEAYTGFEFARAHGFVRGLGQTIVNPSAQGTLHDAAALIVFTVAGPSRSAALALNMLALIAWQAALFFAVRRWSDQMVEADATLPATRSPESRAISAPPRRANGLALAAVALPLALAGPWANVPGSAYDFRLDHLAMCALGVTSAMALVTDGFRARGWSIAFGVAVGVTLLTRFLTGTYLMVIFTALLGWILTGESRGRRAVNLALAAAVAFAMAAPIFWLNRDAVWNYYYIGHYVGPESAIRNQNMGLARSIAFVVTELARRHLGGFWGLLVVVGALLWAMGRRAASPHGSASPSPRHAGAWIVGAVFLLAPALVLTLHSQKSEVVISALAPGAIVLAIALWQTIARGRETRLRLAIGGAIAAAAVGFFAWRQSSPAYDSATRDAIRRVNTLADQIHRRARAAGLREPRVAVDHITDALDAQVLRVICYERQHAWIGFDMTLPTGIAEPAEAEVMARVRRSDFVFLTEDTTAGRYPFDTKLAALRPTLRAWCDENLRATERFTLFGRSMVLYQRREIPLP
jgi:hypothetical protein